MDGPEQNTASETDGGQLDNGEHVTKGIHDGSNQDATSNTDS